MFTVFKDIFDCLGFLDLAVLPFEERSVGKKDSLLVLDGDGHFDVGLEGRLIVFEIVVDASLVVSH